LKKAYSEIQEPTKVAPPEDADVQSLLPKGGRPALIPEEALDTEDMEALANLWDDVGKQCDVMREKKEKEVGVVCPKADDPAMELISYREVEKWLSHMQIDMELLQPLYDDVAMRGHCCCSKPQIVPGLDRKRHSKGRDIVLFLKLKHFDFNELEHFRMLRTMYLKLTRNKVCPSIGKHWEELGFQNTDPRTDLNRSGGVLNIVHLFYFFAHYFDILKAAYWLAQDTEQNFPLACVSINITRMVTELFLEGRLSSFCNRQKTSVTETLCKLYAGGLHYFYMRWRTLKRTIRDTEKTFKEVHALMMSRPKKLLDELTKGVNEKKAKNDASRLEFTELNFGSARAPQQDAQGSAAAAAKSKAKAKAVPALPKRLRNYVDDSEL
jgi:hypothetical protein